MEHPKPVTRRQFISQGLIAAGGFLIAPGVLDTLLGKSWVTQALADQCEPPTANLMPFLLFDCAGGAGLSGNWVVGKEGGPEDLLKSYDQMGVPGHPSNGLPIDRRFGAPLYSSLSKVFEGLITSASPEALANLRMGTVCSFSQDDSSGNALSPLVACSKAGLTGRHIGPGLGMFNTPSGGNSKGVITDPRLIPINISGADDVSGVLSFGRVIDQLSPAQKQALNKMTSNLSASQAKKLASLPGAQQFNELVRCGYLKAGQYVNTPTGLDPRLDIHCQEVFQITPQSTSAQARVPAIVYNVLQKNSGPGAITIGGCDYHDGTQATGDAKDLEIGQSVARAVELAHRMKTPLFFAIVSDGSVYSDPGTRVWRGDSGIKGLAVMGYYHPSRPPEMRRFQIGHYVDGQGVERQTYIGSEPKRVAWAIFANYLNVNGKLGEFEKHASSSDFEKGQLDAHLLFS